MENYKDEDIRAFTDWLLGFMGKGGWATRREKIEDYIESVIMEGNLDGDSLSKPVSVYQDRIGWYIYLAEMAMTDAIRYEPVQGARVLPIFRVLGKFLVQLKSIEGITKKARELVQKRPTEADATLFEMLVGVLWVRNGWAVVMPPATGKHKSPDLLAKKGDAEWGIECKRLLHNSEYAKNERAKWLRMLKYISPLLISKNLLLDVVFHVELTGLSDQFLLDELGAVLNAEPVVDKTISNELWTVHVSNVDLNRFHDHLRDFSVRMGSPQINELIAGRRDSSRGFTHGLVSKNFRYGGGKGFNVFVSEVANAYGVFWSCDAQGSIEAKSRDVIQQVKNAIRQLHGSKKSVVHIGIETYDGVEVEKQRFEKINQSMLRLDSEMTENLYWVHCNFLQTYAPPDQSWVVDESHYQFRNVSKPLEDPLLHKTLVVPWNLTEEDNLHWFKPEP
jgi:hypothetical protein